ncbi:hypothetical protein DCS_02293 [Drechmeria coniospora]|uniref:Uncharacterized protein n=1 Tax=Drechmeria coniospora TaxID=98403 RepID=A0A151GVV0_DRECN|nr:hypothetical protein DCS_02293 [Drechmeria coniospora]KYK61152.1 hypothetical protein DCS_02293 [Drechmeria coniospora]
MGSGEDVKDATKARVNIVAMVDSVGDEGARPCGVVGCSFHNNARRRAFGALNLVLVDTWQARRRQEAQARAGTSKNKHKHKHREKDPHRDEPKDEHKDEHEHEQQHEQWKQTISKYSVWSGLLPYPPTSTVPSTPSQSKSKY